MSIKHGGIFKIISTIPPSYTLRGSRLLFRVARRTRLYYT